MTGISLSSNRPFLSRVLTDVRLKLSSSKDDIYVDELLQYSREVSLLYLSGHISQRLLTILPKFSYISKLQLFFSTPHSSEEIKLMPIAFARFIGGLNLFHSLTHLTLFMPPAFTCVLPNASLSTIKSVKIRGKISFIYQLLSYTRDLEFIGFYSTDLHPLQQEWLQCFGLFLRTSASTLRTLVFGSASHIQLDQIIHPLLQIHGLRSFQIIHHRTSTMRVGDEDIKKMVDAWPSLEEFLLPTSSSCVFSELTLRSLNAFARLPNLRLLKV